jgi:hypothetical protein
MLRVGERREAQVTFQLSNFKKGWEESPNTKGRDAA